VNGIASWTKYFCAGERDERQLFLDLGFPSLFEYCLVTLGLCESTAGRQIAAARVCRNYPQVFAMVASGALHASALSLLRKHLTPENAGELFELCTHRGSARKVEELLAARFARRDVRDLVRRFPRFATPEAVSPAQAWFTLNVGCSAEQAPTEAPSREPADALEKAPIESPAREPPAGRRSATKYGNSAHREVRRGVAIAPPALFLTRPSPLELLDLELSLA